jgi:hypothetical protein
MVRMRDSDRAPLDGTGSPVKPAPRFVPTLTEMVDPADVNRVPDSPGPTVEELIDQVQRRVQPNLERRVEQVLYRLVGELIAKRWSTISVDLSQEVNDLIADAVREAVAQQKTGQS